MVALQQRTYTTDLVMANYNVKSTIIQLSTYTLICKSYTLFQNCFNKIQAEKMCTHF
jgi:hypothetical protein